MKYQVFKNTNSQENESKNFSEILEFVKLEMGRAPVFSSCGLAFSTLAHLISKIQNIDKAGFTYQILLKPSKKSLSHYTLVSAGGWVGWF